MRWLFKGGRLIVPAVAADRLADVLVEDGRVVSLEAETMPDAAEGATVLDITGKVICPGFVDLHTHLREPGFEYKETIASGVRSAAAGGFTTICCMPNTNPSIDNAAMVAFVKARAAEAGPLRVLPMGSITRGMGQHELADLGELAEAGVCAFTDDAFPIQSAGLMRTAMQYAASFDLPVVTHCEDKSLTEAASMNEGYVSAVLGLKGMPHTAEEVQVARNILLAEETGARLHIAHISTRRSVGILHEAHMRGQLVTAEACPHHFSLTDSAVAGETPGAPGRAYDTNTKMNPPLRTAEDVRAVMEALGYGAIECIATDHAPHSQDDKDVEFGAAPFGIVGFETALAVSLTYLVHTEFLTLANVVRLLTSRPAGVLRAPGSPEGLGDLRKGLRADVTVFDPYAEWTVDPAQFKSRSRNTPYAGHRLKGRVIYTMVAGELIYRAD